MKIITGDAPKLYHYSGPTGQCRTVASRFLLGHIPVDEQWGALGKDRQEYIEANASRYLRGVGDIDSMPTPPPEELDAQAICRTAFADFGVNAEVPGKPDTQILTCLGALFHDDLHGWDNSVFLNWYLAGPPREFAVAGVGRVTIRPGDAMFFDPSRPHALLKAGQARFSKVGWGDPVRGRSLFLSWDIELTSELEHLFGIERGASDALQDRGHIDTDQLQVMKATGAVRKPVIRKPAYLLAA